MTTAGGTTAGRAASRAGAGRAAARGAGAKVAGSLPPGWSASSHVIEVGGLSREYLTVEPRVLTGPVPVVVLMHGRGMTPGGILGVTGLVRRIGPAVIIVPAGWRRSWDAGDCCGAAWIHRIDDVHFIGDAVANVLAVTPEAEAARIYAVGFSNGGRMAYDLACDLPDLFSGFMAVEAVPVEACPSARPIDMTIVAQQHDPLLAVDARQSPRTIGGFVEPTVAQTLRRMASVDHCSGDPEVTTSGLSVERTWSCPGGVLRYVWYPGGGHNWRASRGSTPGASAFVAQLIGRAGPPETPAGPNAGGGNAVSVTAAAR